MRARIALRNERVPSSERREPPPPVRGLKIGSSSSRAISVTGFPPSSPVLPDERHNRRFFVTTNSEWDYQLLNNWHHVYILPSVFPSNCRITVDHWGD